jgi:oligopeptide transport system ATP-binding protein
VGEALDIYRQANDNERRDSVARLLRTVGLEADTATSYPHELSGGQKQRIGIARALALNPKIIIADEPVSALDVSIQAQILNLMVDIQEQLGLAYLFVAHDLSVIRHLSHRVAVMYLGKIVELAGKKELFEKPLHPYTVALLSDVTSVRGKKKEHIILPGDMPSPLRLPPGCRFNTRCNRRMPVCTEREPSLDSVGPGHSVACHLYD